MKLFDAVLDELFSVLASPNRSLYAGGLDVLYEAYQENLKIPEDTLYSMLRSKLEQQLAEATFDGEDIDGEELRDIFGWARFLIRPPPTFLSQVVRERRSCSRACPCTLLQHLPSVGVSPERYG